VFDLFENVFEIKEIFDIFTSANYSIEGCREGTTVKLIFTMVSCYCMTGTSVA
jgi:hypothetical protein